MMVHFAKEDPALTPDRLEAFLVAVRFSNALMDMQIHKARHGFDYPGGPNFNKAVHEDSRRKTLKFLYEFLK